MEENLNLIISSVGGFLALIVAYIIGIFAFLGTVVTSVVAFIVSIWAGLLALFTWLLPAKLIALFSTAYGSLLPIVSKVAPFITVGKQGKKLLALIKRKLKLKNND